MMQLKRSRQSSDQYLPFVSYTIGQVLIASVHSLRIASLSRHRSQLIRSNKLTYPSILLDPTPLADRQTQPSMKVLQAVDQSVNVGFLAVEECKTASKGSKAVAPKIMFESNIAPAKEKNSK